jgi:hypothetical protein
MTLQSLGIRLSNYSSAQDATNYSPLLSPWIYSRGHGRQQTCTEYGNGAHEPREPPNPGAHLSKRGGMPLTCQINILFNRKWPLMFQPSNQHRNKDKFGHRLTLGLYYSIQTFGGCVTTRGRRKNWHVFVTNIVIWPLVGRREVGASWLLSWLLLSPH